MNKIVESIKKVTKFFDKKLITPFTKFFVLITEKTKELGIVFEKLFSKKSSLVVVSLIISLGIFYYVDTKSTSISETSAEVIYKMAKYFNVSADYILGITDW